MMLYKILSTSNFEKFNHIVISFMNKKTMIGKRMEELGVQVYSLNIKRKILSFHSLLFRLLRLVSKIKPDVIVGWMYHANMAALIEIMLSFRKIKLIWNIRQTTYNLKDEKKLTAFLIKLGATLSHKPNRIIFNSKASLECHKKIGYQERNSVFLPNGFDCKRFRPDLLIGATFRETIVIADDAILIGLVGRYHPMKDHENFFQAAGKLSIKYPHVHFVLAGQGLEKNNIEIMKLIKQNNIEGKVHLLGERDDIHHILPAFDIVSSSSWSEAFPNIIGEAMACGVPCVVTDVGDSAWVVDHTGFIVPPKDSQALADSWEKLIKAGKKKRAEMGKSARQRILDHFSLDVVSRQYDKLFQEVYDEN